MFRDPIASKEANDQAANMIKHKMIKVAETLADPNLCDTDFTSNLFDLCVLNKMADSHIERGRR